MKSKNKHIIRRHIWKGALEFCEGRWASEPLEFTAAEILHFALAHF